MFVGPKNERLEVLSFIEWSKLRFLWDRKKLGSDLEANEFNG